MNTHKILSVFNVNLHQIKFDEKFSVLDNGMTFLYTNYQFNDGSIGKFYVLTDVVYLQFGLSSFKTSQGTLKWNADISFYKKEENPGLNALFNLATELDKFAIDLVEQKCETWYGKKKSREVLEDKFIGLVRRSPGDKYAPTLKVHANSLPNNKSKFSFPITDSQDNVIECSPTNEDQVRQLVPKGSKVRMILEFSNLWFAKIGGFGWSCKCRQMFLEKKNSNNLIETPFQLSNYYYNDSGNLIEQHEQEEQQQKKEIFV